MSYKNIFKIKKLNYKMLDIGKFADKAYTESCINFNVENNQLVNSYGEKKFECYRNNYSEEIVNPLIGDLEDIVDIKFFVRSSKDKSADSKKQLYALTSDNKLIFSNLNDGSTTLNELAQLEGEDFKLFTYFHDTSNYLVVSSKNDNKYKLAFYDGFDLTPEVEIETPSHVCDICKHNNYLFLTTEDNSSINTLYYIEDENPYNITFQNMGELSIPVEYGKVLKLISLDDLYVFCEYGIYKINVYDNKKETNIENVYLKNSRIIKNSIVVCGNDIMFADNSSLYKFNGTNVSIIDIEIKNKISEISNNSVACFNDNKYFLATKINYDNNALSQNNSLIVYDVNNDQVSICHNIQIEKMINYQDVNTSRIAILSKYNMKTMLYTLDNNGVINNKQSTKIWTSSRHDFHEYRLIKSMYIQTDENVKISLVDGNNFYDYFVEGNNAEQKIIINRKVKNCYVSIMSETPNPVIKSIKLLVGTYE